MRSVPLGALALGIVAISLRAAAEPARHRLDEKEMNNERVLRPHVAEVIERGEAALRGGELEKAAALFHRATEGSPDGAFAYRLECQALTALGRRDEAMRACHRAVANQGSGMDFRALVGAIVSGPPTPTELADAFGFAKRARDIMPTEPWGYAAQCDIAKQLGDTIMLSQCFEELERVAPDHDETKRVAAMIQATRHPWRFAIGWTAIAALFLVTAWRALRWLAHRRAAVLASFAALALSVPARADETEGRTAGSLSQWRVNDADPVASVPTAAQRDSNPLEYGYFIMDLSDRADQATSRGDHASAAKYWLALEKAVPDRSIGYSKACESYEALGDWPHAVDACRTALRKDGVLVKDYARFVTVMLTKKDALAKPEVEEIDKVLGQLRRTQSDVADELSCDVGVRLGDAPRLQQCTAALAVTAPNDPRTIFFQWSLALLDKRVDEATKLIARAKDAGTSPERLRQMERATVAVGSVWQRIKRRWAIAGGGVAFAALGIALTLRAARRRPLARRHADAT